MPTIATVILVLRSIFGKTIWERRRSMPWWIGGLAFLLIVTILSYPSFKDTQGLEDLFKNMQPMLAMFGVESAADLFSPVGLINARMYESIGILVIGAFAISMGTAALAGEEDRGTMELLLMQPISRRSIVLQKHAALTVLLIGINVFLAIVLFVGNPVLDGLLSVQGILAANVGATLVGFLFGSLALAIGGVTGKRGMTNGISAGYLAAAFFFNGIANIVDGLKWTQKLTPFYWFSRADPLANGFPMGDFVVLLVVGLVLVGVGLWGFDRRDVVV
ncbi:hypothetical protein MNBD_ACTINO02-2561 [hydrothermal vent metagenome]|uniref:Uncharacterized protein n=1 Tax=hydrothermal vent metagenome TaxID=652676 RepID=A0A3B0SVW0_9ZZZZ